jgi:GTPase Era involved in 16S rRNA processing
MTASSTGSSSAAPLRLAVVGHTNTGKTSLMRTLLRDVQFGDVSDRPSVTQHVEGSMLLIDDQPVLELFDTPGLEDSINLLDALNAMAGDRRVEAVDVIERFLETDAAHSQFAQEAKVIRQVLRSDVALYVIDVRDRVLGKHRDELEILRRCACPIVPVLNFLDSPDSKAQEWRSHLARAALHAVAEFDTVVYDHAGERRLYEKIRTLIDQHADRLDQVIAYRARQRQDLMHASARVVAELLVDVASARLLVPINDQAAVAHAVKQLKNEIRRREHACVKDLLELHQFAETDVREEGLDISRGHWGMDLFSPEALRSVAPRVTSGAAAGATVGLALDVMLAGLSLGTGAAVGAAVGAAAGTWRTHVRKLVDRVRGRSELRCEDATLLLLQGRQLTLVHAMLRRGHAAQSTMTLSVPSTTASTIHRALRRSRANPEWSGLPLANDDLHRTGATPSPARELAVGELADSLESIIRAEAPDSLR